MSRPPAGCIGCRLVRLPGGARESRAVGAVVVTRRWWAFPEGLSRGQDPDHEPGVENKGVERNVGGVTQRSGSASLLGAPPAGGGCEDRPTAGC